MRLTVVGSSGSVPGPDSACSCYLLEQDGFRLLLDLGTGAVGPLQRYVAPADVDAVVVTHAHGDHWADLVELGYLRTLPDVEPVPPLAVHGPANLRPVVREENPSVYALTTISPGARRVGPFDLRFAAVEHIEHSHAVRVDDALCYTGDTAPCAALDELAAGCAVLLAEASGVSGPLRGGHLTAADAGPARGPVRRAPADPHPPAPVAGPRRAAGGGGTARGLPRRARDPGIKPGDRPARAIGSRRDG